VVQQSFWLREDLAFADILSEEEIQTAFDEEGVTFAQRKAMCTRRGHIVGLLSQAVFKANIAVAWRPWRASRC